MSEEDVTLIIPDAFFERLDMGIREGLNIVTDDLTKNLRNEIPQGKTGKAKNSVVQYPAQQNGEEIAARIEIGEGIKYIWALWKGIKKGTMTIAPLTDKGMRFTDWATWNGTWKPDSRGWFTFHKPVEHWSPENKFVERAIGKTAARIQFLFVSGMTKVLYK